MTSFNIKPIKIFTVATTNLHIGPTEIKLENTPTHNFYTLTHDQLIAASVDPLLREIIFGTHDALNYTMAYIIKCTDIDTVDFVFGILDKYDDNYLSPIWYIGNACRSVDQLMWKHILDTTITKSRMSMIEVISNCIRRINFSSSNDDLLDYFINVLSYLNFPQLIKTDITNRGKIIDLLGYRKYPPTLDSFYRVIDIFVEDCITNSNFRICKYLLDAFDIEDVHFKLSHHVITAVFQSKYEFVNLILKYSTASTICSSTLQIKDLSLENLQFLHQLIIDERIDVHTDTLESILNNIHIEKNQVTYIYFLTVYPLMCNVTFPYVNVNKDCIEDLIEDIETDNRELLEMLETIDKENMQKVDEQTGIMSLTKCIIM